MDKGDIRSYSETYKLKLDVSQSPGYVPFVQSADNIAGSGIINSPNEANSMCSLNMPGQVFFDLPALNTNSTQALMRIKAVTIPVSQYTLRTINRVDVGAGVYAIESTFNHGQGNHPIFYVTASNVSNRSYMSYSNGTVGLKDILGSINITSNLITNISGAAFNEKEAVKVHKENNYSNIIDDSWVLCTNPFGSRLHLNLINSVGEYPIIKSSTDGLPGGITVGTLANYLIDSSLVYELEVKLIEQL
tara:strand:+ start:208 stop:948 length:741 start_codon:yes stop_codon:yes gene_type:complete